jgi:hypothetical protein
MWPELIRSRTFWIAYLSACVNFQECESLSADENAALNSQPPKWEVTFTFSFDVVYWLILKVRMGENWLELLHPRVEKRIPLGHIDCHHLKDALRWEEYVAITRSLAQNQTPAWAYELMLLVYVAATKENVDRLAEKMKSCLHASQVFRTEEIDYIATRVHRWIRPDLRWIDTPNLGWVVEGASAYSRRKADQEFNFAAFREFMHALGDAAPGGV